MKKGTLGRIIAILSTYVPAGIAYGTLATAVHVPWYYTIGLSLAVYSGAVQSAFVGLWSIGFDPLTMVITAFLLNLRHTFYGPHLAENYPELSSADMYSIAPFLTDELYALAVSEPRMDASGVRILGFFAYGCWTVSSAVGVAFAGILPGFLYPILFLALPALFLALMVPRIRGASTVVSAIVSIGMAMFLRIYSYPDYAILISISAGILAGLIVLKAGGRK